MPELNAQITTFPYGTHDPKPVTLLEQAGFCVRPSPHGRKHQSHETQALLGDVDVLIAGTETLDPEVLSAGLPRLKHISKVGVGLDGVDIRYCMDNNIAVTYTPDAPARSVVEQVFGLLISVSRHFHESHRAMRDGRWLRMTGPLWEGKTLGILGCGRIGKQVAVVAQAFRMRVIAHDIKEDPEWAAANNVQYVDMQTLLADSDALTCHLPLTSQTRGIMDADKLGAMKSGSYLINTCRGPIMNEEALATVVRSGHLAGAALDVFCKEPYKGPLAEIENIMLTCHQGSCSFEGRYAMEVGAAENAIAVATGSQVKADNIVWLPGMAEPTVPIEDF